jgi:hypothetical protein
MLTLLRVGPLELAVLTALWDSGRPLTIREVRDQLSYRRWLSYTAVAEAPAGGACDTTRAAARGGRESVSR